MKEITWLYLAAKKGNKVQKWGIQNLGDGSFVTHEGFVDGKISVSEPTLCEPKNVGKSNETTPISQCELEVAARIQKKKDKGYSADSENISRPFVPTLAKVYGDHKKKVQFPVMVSWKMDGMRCVLRKEGMFSRERKPIVSAPHIRESFEEYFKKNPEAVIDGELYADKKTCNFNEIMSLVKQSKPTQSDFDLARAKIEFHIFDIVHSEPYSQRIKICEESFKNLPFVKVVPSFFIENEEDLFRIHGRFVEKGYEGTMIRWGKEGYILERTDKLLKLKNFFDEEFKVKRVESGRGKRANTVAKWVLEDANGEEFEANPSGSDGENMELWENRDSLSGQWATITFQELTPDGVPRFGVFKSLRDKSEILA